jgi:hypothetical protein
LTIGSSWPCRIFPKMMSGSAGWAIWSDGRGGTTGSDPVIPPAVGQAAVTPAPTAQETPVPPIPQ